MHHMRYLYHIADLQDVLLSMKIHTCTCIHTLMRRLRLLPRYLLPPLAFSNTVRCFALVKVDIGVQNVRTSTNALAL